MTADQPAEATQPRWWFATVTRFGAVERDVVLYGPDTAGDFFEGVTRRYAHPNEVADLCPAVPAVVVPQREDEGEIPEPGWMCEPCQCYPAGVAYGPEPSNAWGCPQHGAEAAAWRAGRDAALSAQHPAATVGDVALLDAEVAGFERGYRNAVEDYQHGGFRYGHEQAVAPVAVDDPGQSATPGPRHPAGSPEGHFHAPHGEQADSRVAPTPVDVPTVARVLEQAHRDHRPVRIEWSNEYQAMTAWCACGVALPDGGLDLATHFGQIATAKAIRYLATRDEDGSEATMARVLGEHRLLRDLDEHDEVVYRCRCGRWAPDLESEEWFADQHEAHLARALAARGEDGDAS